MQQLKSTLNEHTLIRSLGDIIFRPGGNPGDLIKANFKQTASLCSIIGVIWLMLLGAVITFLPDWRTWYVSVGIVIMIALMAFLGKMLWNSVQMLYSTQWVVIGSKGILSQRRGKKGQVLQQTLIRFSPAMNYRQMGKTIEIRQGKDRLVYRDGPRGTYAAVTFQAATQAVVNYRPSKGNKTKSTKKRRK